MAISNGSDTQRRPLRAIVVGGGIGGLAASVALRRAGHSVVVLEKEARAREVGYAVSVHPNSSRVLLSLGVDLRKAKATDWNGLDYIRADRNPPQFMPRRYLNAQEVYGAPHLCCHRIDLHEELREKASDPSQGNGPPVDIQEGTRVVEYDVQQGSVKLESGDVLHADLIVAADGIHSEAHKWIIGEHRPATLSKLWVIRFVIPTETLMKNPKTGPLFEELHSEGSRASVWAGESGRIGMFHSPCRDNTIQNFVIYHIANEHQTVASKWVSRADRDMALELLQREGFDDSVQEIVRCSDETDMYLWKVGDRDPLPNLQSGRLLVLGDAAHPMRPDHGQGASQAIEDAGVLGVVIEGALRDEVSERLRLWEELRIARVGVTQLCSRSETMAFELAEENVAKLKNLLPPEDMPELTRPSLFQWWFAYDCIAEGRRLVKERLKDARCDG